MKSLHSRMDELKKKREKAIIAFLMAGQPDEEICLDCIQAVEAGGADVLELGVPYTDPLADGELLQRFHERGIKGGWNLERSLFFVERVRAVCSLPVIIFSYYNPLYRMGITTFSDHCRDLGVEAVLIPDLPLDERSREKEALEIIPMIAPGSTEERIKMAAAKDPSFIYCVSVPGVTGVRHLPVEEIKKYLLKAGSLTDRPLAIGFGISRPEQVQAFSPYADAFVVGSYLGEIMEKYAAEPGQIPARIEAGIAALKIAAEET